MKQFNKEHLKVVLASSNQGKLLELQSLLSPLNCQLIAQNEFGIHPCPEPASTFIENAILKARHAAQQSGLASLADDSGLIVPSLNGAPGVYSARYASEKANMSENIQKLLTEMSAFSGAERAAFFYCVLVFMRHANDPTPIVAQGYWYGQILLAEQGEGGFGYDSIFGVREKNCSAAQLTREEKNQLSHRGMAMRELLKQLSR